MAIGHRGLLLVDCSSRRNGAPAPVNATESTHTIALGISTGRFALLPHLEGTIPAVNTASVVAEVHHDRIRQPTLSFDSH